MLKHFFILVAFCCLGCQTSPKQRSDEAIQQMLVRNHRTYTRPSGGLFTNTVRTVLLDQNQLRMELKKDTSHNEKAIILSYHGKYFAIPLYKSKEYWEYENESSIWKKDTSARTFTKELMLAVKHLDINRETFYDFDMPHELFIHLLDLDYFYPCDTASMFFSTSLFRNSLLKDPTRDKYQLRNRKNINDLLSRFNAKDEYTIIFREVIWDFMDSKMYTFDTDSTIGTWPDFRIRTYWFSEPEKPYPHCGTVY